MWNKHALYYTYSFSLLYQVYYFYGHVSFFAHIDFQHESVEIVNSRLVSPTLTIMSPTNTNDVSDVK